MDLKYCLEALRVLRESAKRDKELRELEHKEVSTPALCQINVVGGRPSYTVSYGRRPVRGKVIAYRCHLDDKFIAKL